MSAALLLAAAQVAQDALAPAGPQARRLAELFWAFTWVAAAVLALVVLFLLAGAIRARRRAAPAAPPVVDLPPGAPEPARPREPPDPAGERRLGRWVGAAVALTVVILFVLLGASVSTGAAVARFGREPAVTIQIVGHRWWWEVTYEDPEPWKMARTANEIHVPVGKPVRVKLESRDVIHSFWVPSLHGKADLIPGRKNQIVLQADAPGVYRGQCAEFCGYAHAQMAFEVVAEDEATFQAWLARQREPAAEPRDETARRGREVFLRGACATCHAIRGTVAGATVGPDLTHVGGRRTLAAGQIPNVKGHLAGWIANSQSVKPGNDMPAVALSPDELDAVTAYLETLE